jgi:hypothetical protein
MTFRNSDKVWHFIISIALVFFAFLFLTYCVYRRRRSHDFNFFRRLGQAGLFSLVFGLAKEIGDALPVDWFWCGGDGCYFDIWDVAVNVDGAVVGVLLVIVMKMFTLPPLEREAPCERTVASSVDCDDDDFADNVQHAASSTQGSSDDEIPAEISVSDDSTNTGRIANINTNEEAASESSAHTIANISTHSSTRSSVHISTHSITESSTHSSTESSTHSSTENSTHSSTAESNTESNTESFAESCTGSSIGINIGIRKGVESDVSEALDDDEEQQLPRGIVFLS